MASKEEIDKAKKDGRDGFQSDADAFESHPDFVKEHLKMSAEFFKEKSPGYYALMERLKNADKKPT